MSARIAIVGQGPNRASWLKAIATAEALHPWDGEERHFRHAIRHCAHLAITGSIGRKLAALAGYDLKAREELRFYAKHARRNLNEKWNGKSGKGDRFDEEEGTKAAARILAEGFDRHVLLGREVAKCFGFPMVPFLEEKLVHNVPLNKPQWFLIFPHPSGLSTWWNDPFNDFRARKRLREFLST